MGRLRALPADNAARRQADARDASLGPRLAPLSSWQAARLAACHRTSRAIRATPRRRRSSSASGTAAAISSRATATSRARPARSSGCCRPRRSRRSNRRSRSN
jgi:hypothetical protein